MNNNEIIVPELNNETIESMICEIRGVKVMLDFDLARIYGYETRRFNEQIKNNIERFDNDFRFQLTRNELSDLMMSKKSTSRNINYFSGNTGGTRKLPYAFTEQGIYMLMTVLKGEIAVKQSKTLIRLFKQMKDYLIESNNSISLNEVIRLLNNQDQKYAKKEDVNKLKLDLEKVMNYFVDPKTYKPFVIFKGERIEAINAYQSIYKKAKFSIDIIDDYVDTKTLELLKCCNNNIKITIYTDNKAKNGLTKRIIDDFINDTNMNITLKENKISHDRFIAIDLDYDCYFYLCGSSSKDSGNRLTVIEEIDNKDICKTIFNKLSNCKIIEL